MIRYRKYVPAWRQTHWYGRLSGAQPNAQTLFDRLVTGEFTSIIPGLMCIGVAGLHEKLRWEAYPLEDTKRALDELINAGIVYYDFYNKVIFCPVAFQGCEPEQPQAVRAWQSAWAEIPDSALKAQAWQFFHDHFAGLITEDARTSKPGYLKTFEEVCPRPHVPASDGEATSRPSPPGTSPPSSNGTCPPSSRPTSQGSSPGTSRPTSRASSLQDQDQEQEQEQKKEQNTRGSGSTDGTSARIAQDPPVHEPASQRVTGVTSRAAGGALHGVLRGNAVPTPPASSTTPPAVQEVPETPRVTPYEALAAFSLGAGGHLLLGNLIPATPPPAPGLAGVLPPHEEASWMQVFNRLQPPPTLALWRMAGRYLRSGQWWMRDGGPVPIEPFLDPRKGHLRELLSAADAWNDGPVRQRGRRQAQARPGHVAPSATTDQRRPSADDLRRHLDGGGSGAHAGGGGR